MIMSCDLSFEYSAVILVAVGSYIVLWVHVCVIQPALSNYMYMLTVLYTAQTTVLLL